MKKLFLVSVLAISAAFATAASAAPKIAVLDTQAVLSGTNAAERARKDIQEQAKKADEERKSLEADLTKKNKALQEQRESLSKEKYAEKEQALMKEIRESQAKVGTQQREIGLEMQKYNQEILAVIKKVTDEVAAEKGFDLVLPKNATVFNADALDISKEVLKRSNTILDKK